jgi:probable phosphoglycerate mutase
MNTESATATLRPVSFWYLRHGETDWNARNLSQGRVDIPLNANGLAQAQEAAGLLRNRGIRAIVSSPLSRARVTAEIVAETLGLPVQFDPDLRETAFGVQEGQPMGNWYDGWVEGTFTPEGGESFEVLRARGVAGVNRAIDLPPVVLVVAHGALFRALRSAMGLVPNVRTRNGVPFFCAPPAAGEAVWTLSPPEPGMELTLPPQ